LDIDRLVWVQTGVFGQWQQKTELGINPNGTIPNTKIETTKLLNGYQTKQKSEFLRSTSAPITDTWSIKGKPFLTKGGARQLFTPNNSAYTVTNQ